MDHSHDVSGVPWLDQPVMLHSSREDSCSLTPEQCEYRRGYWRYWYHADRVYAQGTVYFMCATIGVFAIHHFFRRLRYAESRPFHDRLSSKARAIVRFLSYRGLHLPASSWFSDNLGVVALILIGILFFSLMTLAPKPYYWPNTRTVSFGNSPPIATRTGWMALALLPFVLALAAKANMISALTGVSHEKLQVFHQWASYAMFVLALVHTFPFIVHHIWKGDMELEWRTSVVYWTGVVALIFQAYLTIMSLPAIRNRYYEFFKATHFLAALIFILFFFFHCDFRLSSWDYFIASGAIYLVSLLYAQLKTCFVHGVLTATVDRIPGGLIRLSVPTRVPWKAGQHVFVRFLGLGAHCLTAHPFTICSLPHETENCGNRSEMIFYIQPRTGVTARLAKLADSASKPSIRVLIEGPYGGLNTGSLGTFDTSLVISGGSGAGFSLAVAEDALRQHRYLHRQTDSEADAGPLRPRLHLVYATRHAAAAQWFADAVRTLCSSYARWSEITAAVHITASEQELIPSQNDKDTSTPGDETDVEKTLPDLKVLPSEPESGRSDNLISSELGRPNIPAIISSFASGDTVHGQGRLGGGRSIGIAACGPASLLHDVRNAAAEAQAAVLAGNNDLIEVYLHSERFSW
ncbi:hypothetical protein VTO42DRAFT_4158 [Malbranchea cinnamomea]